MTPPTLVGIWCGCHWRGWCFMTPWVMCQICMSSLCWPVCAQTGHWVPPNMIVKVTRPTNGTWIHTMPHTAPPSSTMPHTDSTPWLHTYEKCHTPIWGHNVSCETSHTTPPIHTTIFTHNHKHNKGSWGVYPWVTKHKAHMKKGGHRGLPWANPANKKDNKLLFLLHNHFSKEGGFQGGGFPPCRNGNKKHYCFLYLPVSPCPSLPLFAFVLFVSDCMFVVFVQPIQPPTYTIQPINE